MEDGRAFNWVIAITFVVCLILIFADVVTGVMR